MASYDGGKGQAGVFQRLVCQMPPHDVYVEPFAGHGAVYLAKRPARQSYLCDLDPECIAWIVDASSRKGLPAPLAVVGDGVDLLMDSTWSRRCLVYCDPPYLFETRSGGSDRIYKHEFGSREAHCELLTVLCDIDANVMISGYPSSLYSSMLEGWRELRYQVVRRSGELATECLWMNFPEPLELHDYRYLGEGFRERERIKRKRDRWVTRLRAMPRLERLSLAAAIAEVAEAASSPAASMTAEGRYPGAIVGNGGGVPG